METRIPGMPFLPGTVFRDLSKTNFTKTQYFMTSNGINMLSDRHPPKLVNVKGTIADPNCPPPELPSLYPPKTGIKLPPWIAYDKQVLCFHAYFKETLQEVYHAPYQVRKVKILYFLEDGTITVHEPPVENSGIPQGCLVHRQRIPKPHP
uniref:DM10 domain-containing protein n=1 Tax=Megaselia scalaris TaxID=36166 RepID=T1H1C0_MEGSC